MKFAGILPLFLVTTHAAKREKELLRRGLQSPTYIPGDLDNGLIIEDEKRGTKVTFSVGLNARAIAHNGEPLIAANGKELAKAYHESSDGGACIPKKGGGYYYVSNSEQGEYPSDFDIEEDDDNPDYRKGDAFDDKLTGGAYSLEFDKDHNLVGYKQILFDTAGNCAGGATPWGTWVSCEERREFGRCWQADPTGERDAVPTNVTGVRGIPDYGYWEAVAVGYDEKTGQLNVFVTDDDWPVGDLPKTRGTLVWFTPDDEAKALGKNDEWMLLSSGNHTYLKLNTETSTLNTESSTFEWVADIDKANPLTYGGSEGVHYDPKSGIVTFATVKDKLIFRLNLNDGTYKKYAVPFPQEPDNLRVLGDTTFVCTDGDDDAGDGIWGMDDKGAYQIFTEEGHNYPAGVAFSPDGKYMYFSMWGEATWQVWREDGGTFDDMTGLNPVYTDGFDGW